MTKPMPLRLRKGLNGPAGLLASVIALAVEDAIDPKSDRHLLDAWAYLGSGWYRHSLECLGMPSDARPAALKELNVGEFIAITDRLRSLTRETEIA